MKDYIEFLKDKMAISHQTGFEVNPDELTPSLYPHVKDTVRWAVSGGCRAIFSSFGMQKTVTQLEICRVIINQYFGKALIVCPKRVVTEFITQAKEHMNMTVKYVKNMSEVKSCKCDIMITNYERVRDGEDGIRIDPSYFTVTSLDEASVTWIRYEDLSRVPFAIRRCSLPFCRYSHAIPESSQGIDTLCRLFGCNGHRTGSHKILQAR